LIFRRGRTCASPTIAQLEREVLFYLQELFVEMFFVETRHGVSLRRKFLCEIFKKAKFCVSAMLIYNIFMLKKYQFINQKYWEENLSRKDWYLRLAKDFKKYIIKPEIDEGQTSGNRRSDLRKIKREIYYIVNEFYKKNKLYLGKSGENWDKERKLIKYIVLHHTSSSQNIFLSMLSIIQMIRLYIGRYLVKDMKPKVYGQPLWSNHFRRGKMVFFAYHWLIRSDGSAQRLLQDNQIGWHAGRWPINCASIAICFSGDYENKMPDKKMLDAAVKIIRENYPQVKKKNILGHGETRPKPTSCPGKYLGHIKKYILERL